MINPNGIPALDSEVSEKNRILSLLEKNHPEFLEEARRIARHYCHRNLGLGRYRVPHTVTSDCIREQMYIEKGFPGKNNLMGGVFKKGFVRVGTVVSAADGGHGREIKLWTLPQYESAVKKFNRERGWV